MAHNIESMFYTREKPWHGLGTMVQEAPTSSEALRLAGLDWTVEGRGSPVLIGLSRDALSIRQRENKLTITKSMSAVLITQC